MSDLDWREWLFLGIISACLVLLFAGGWSQQLETGRDHAYANQAQYKVPDFVSACSVYDTAEEITTCRREEADLRAQRNIGIAAWFAVGISSVALFGLFFTVFYARQAWIAASASVTQLVSNLAPGQKSNIFLIGMNRLNRIIGEIESENSSEGQTLLDPKHHLHFWGEVLYTDIYNKRHKTAFQFVTFYGDIDEGELMQPTLDLPAFEEVGQQDQSDNQ